MSAHLLLRTATAREHEGVDAAFGAFDLASAHDYTAFLRAHYRALAGLEQALAKHPSLGLTLREPLLRADLAMLRSALPEIMPFDPPESAGALYGTAYVIEGSRLGGILLSRRIPPGIPSAYLRTGHEPGGWRAFLNRLDASAAGPIWIEEAIAAARATFARYTAAAAIERPAISVDRSAR
jgi:heme oxygenase (biliverdin-IX-beta and delta-forming)